MYKAASHPKTWAGHIHKDRYKEDIFCPYFDGALSSGAAFAIIDNQTGTIIGTSRYHDYKEAERCGVTTAEVPGLCDVLGPTGAVR